MSAEIDQGTVIYGIRSSKYPSTPCYGIIITARCDIAQCKVPKYYYLVAVDASAWFCTKHGFEQTFSGDLKSYRDNVNTHASKLSLDGNVLISCTQENQDIILNQRESELKSEKSTRDTFKSLRKALKQYRSLDEANYNNKTRQEAIGKFSKTAIAHLRDIDTGRHSHYYFLPQTSYIKNGIKSKGLIVDLLEIGVLSLQDAQKLISPFSQVISRKDLPVIPCKEDFQYLKNGDSLESLLKGFPEYLRLTHQFWLETDSDFVAIEGTTQSPWCEHMMQRFSNAFIRIGLDNPTQSDFESIISNICTEVAE